MLLASDIISPYLAKIINLSLKKSYFPSDLKCARVTPVYKSKGSYDDPGNYRPISVISYFAKIMEKIIYRQLFTYISNHNFISPAQSAFLKNHSTITSLLHTTSNWNNAIDKGHVSLVCFFDISKCFDCINHSLLLDKLTTYGILNTENRWFRSYLTGRTQATRFNNTLSKFETISIGVPQGSVLGPLLFLLFVNDICKSPLYSQISLFADDTCLYHSGPSIESIIPKIQTDVSRVLKWFSDNKLTVNSEKSFAIVVGSRQKLTSLPFPYPPVTFGETVLKYETVAQYLGVTIDSCLTWKEHINSLTSKIKPKLGALARLSKCLPQAELDTIYKTTIQPYIDYGIIIWGHHSQCNLNMVQKFQNRAARLVTRNFDYLTSSSEIIKSLKWLTVVQRLFYLTNLFMFKCKNGSAPGSFDMITTQRSDIHDYTTRHSAQLQLPLVRTENVRKSFSFQGPLLWNSLPAYFHSINNLNEFKHSLKNYSLTI